MMMTTTPITNGDYYYRRNCVALSSHSLAAAVEPTSCYSKLDSNIANKPFTNFHTVKSFRYKEVQGFSTCP